MENKFKITLKDDFGIYSIELNESCEHIGDYINAFRSVLYSAGFSENLINDYIEEYEPSFKQEYFGE